MHNMIICIILRELVKELSLMGSNAALRSLSSRNTVEARLPRQVSLGKRDVV